MSASDPNSDAYASDNLDAYASDSSYTNSNSSTNSSLNPHPPVPPPRTRPNILLCGTPGTGKTTTAELLALLLPTYTHHPLSTIISTNTFHLHFDAHRNSHVLDEDALLDFLEPLLKPGGVILDHHNCDLFPERWFDLVVVLTCEIGVLGRRLEGRGYAEEKVRENLECEIMGVLVEEAREGYEESVVKVLGSDGLEEMERNVEQIAEWIEALEGRMGNGH